MAAYQGGNIAFEAANFLCLLADVSCAEIFSVAGAQLQSNVELCPEGRVTFNCTVPTNAHTWVIVNGSTTRIIGSVAPGDPSDENFGFVLAVVDLNDRPITSTATVNITADLNGTVIVCRDFNEIPDRAQQENTTVNIIGELIT